MPDINETSWDRERPIGGRLPYEATGAFQVRGGAVSYHGTAAEAPSADHLTVFWDEEIIYVRDRLYQLYDLMFDPDKCDAIYLDWLASLVGFQDTSQFRFSGVGTGNPGEYNYVDHHDINNMSGLKDLLVDAEGEENYRLVRSPKFAAEGGLKTNPNSNQGMVKEPSFLAYPQYINHSSDGDIISVPPAEDWVFTLNGTLWRSDYPEGLKRWLVANAFTKVWNYLGSNELLNQIFTRASLIVTITGDRFDWNVGTSRIGVDPLSEFVPFTYWLRVPTAYVRGEYYWRFVEFINEAYGSAICQSRVCYDGFYPGLSYPGEPSVIKKNVDEAVITFITLRKVSVYAQRTELYESQIPSTPAIFSVSLNRTFTPEEYLPSLDVYIAVTIDSCNVSVGEFVESNSTLDIYKFVFPESIVSIDFNLTIYQTNEYMLDIVAILNVLDKPNYIVDEFNNSLTFTVFENYVWDKTINIVVYNSDRELEG